MSRRFKAATDAQLDELMSRDLSELDLAALMLDGVHFADALATAVRKVFGDTAFNHDDPAKGERACRDLAAQLQVRWPDAAASLREGLEDIFTVRWLGVGGRLAASLKNMLNAGHSFRRLKGYR